MVVTINRHYLCKAPAAISNSKQWQRPHSFWDLIYPPRLHGLPTLGKSTMKSPKRIIKWVGFGALAGYFLLHPLVHIISMFHFFSGGSVPNNLVAKILQAFSVAMLPWGLGFMALSGLIGLFGCKIKQTGEEKSEIIAQLQKALEKVKTLSGFLPICASCKKIREAS